MGEDVRVELTRECHEDNISLRKRIVRLKMHTVIDIFITKEMHLCPNDTAPAE
jgi:hypothetical protein